MAVRLNAAAAGFETQFEAFLATKRETAADVDDAVREIIAAVRARGDTAVRELTERFDGVDFGESGPRIDKKEIAEARRSCDQALVDALILARDRLEVRQKALLPSDTRSTDNLGVVGGVRWTPIASAGLYVPGGTAAYPSSVIMNAVPARVAGVDRIVMAVPAPDGEINPLVLAAADLAGVDEVYKIGGAQAVAALAHGTETISPVDLIVGPGNAYVAAAKRQVFGLVGIDMIAGPSEILVVADAENDPQWIAADLLSQAEHDIAAQSILITDDFSFADAVGTAVEAQLSALPRREIASQSWRTYGAIILVPSLKAALPLIDRIAPEHLEILTNDPEPLVDSVHNAGAIFIGRHTPEVIGDYVGGSNHVLPTARSARFSSGLSVFDFLKRTSILRCDSNSLRALAPAAIALARAEGLEAHARALTIRLNM